MRRLFRRSGVGIAVVIGCLIAPLVAIASAASNPAISAPTTLTVLAGATTPIADVSISSGFSGSVRITASSTAGSIAVDAVSGITATLDRSYQAGSALSGASIGFEGSVAAVNAALATLRLTTVSSATPSSGTVSVWATRAGAAFDPDTGHYYEDVSVSSTWAAAKSAAAARSFNGLAGYLVTMTSAREQLFVKNRVKTTESWIGATDTAQSINAAVGSTVYADNSAAQGHWYWVTGPEAGVHLADQTATRAGSACTPSAVTPFGGAYNAWYPGTPRYCDVALRDYAEFVGSTRQWDVLAAGSTLASYVTEYGGMSESATEQVSASIAVAVAVPPSAISTLAAVPGDTQASLTWTAGTNGGSPATEVVQIQTGGAWTALAKSGSGPVVSDIVASGTSRSAVVTGLTNAQAVSLRVSVSNAVATTNSNVVSTTPFPPPDAPVGLTAAPGNRALGLSWTAPSLGGAPAITAYHLDVVGQPELSRDLPASPTTATLSGLANGTTYTVRLRAKNAIGSGAAAEVTGTPRTVSNSPTEVTGTPADRSVSLSWRAPSDTGGSSISGFTVTASPGDGACVVSESTALCTGLRNGTAYTFSVVATNGSGDSLPGTNPEPITPRTTPDAPTAVRGTPRSGGVALTWTAPADTGGVPVTGYRVTSAPQSGSCAVTGTAAVCDGLANGASYRFAVVAVNAAGDSSPSALSAAVTPRTVPTAPLSVVGTPGNHQVAVEWVAPADDGGAAIELYTVTPKPAAGECVVTGTTALCSGLTNGSGYTFTVSATNAAGTSQQSAPSDAVVPRRVPDPPFAVSGQPDDRAVRLSWTVPASDGGSAIRGYSVVPLPADGACDVTGMSALCTGLTNGRSYTFTVVARNVAGDSLPSSASDPVFPRTVPDAPTDVRVVPTNEAVSVTWTAPGWNGGSAVTGYVVTPSPSNGRCEVTGSAALCSGLTNGRAYTVSVVAVNAAGNSGSSVPSETVTPRTVPQPATDVVGTPANGSVSLVWSAPADDGGSSVTSYVAEASPPDGPCVVTGATALCTGLTNGDSYTFTVTAHNVAGDARPSDASASVVPRTVPDLPRYVDAQPGNQSATVTWVAPAFNGGAPVTGYSVRATPGDGACTVDAPLHATCEGLTNGYAYTFRVVASNVAGDSPPSEASYSTIPRTYPDPPTDVVGTPGDGTVSVTWSMPLYNGGAHIDSYEVTPTPADGTCVVADRTAQCGGLANGRAYTFTVIATNVAGDSAPSQSSDPVTPRRVPDAPTSVLVTPGNTTVDLSWTAPAFDGGSAITGYSVIPDPAAGSCATTGVTAQCTGLANGQAYTFTVVARNVAGDSAASDPSMTVTPRTVPDAPTDVMATPGGASVALTWTAPEWNGGSGITGYRVVAAPSDGRCAVTDTTASCTGLTNGRPYTFTVIASNVAGESTPSAATATVTPRVTPDPPTSVQVTPHNGSVSVTWTPPAFDGGAAISRFTVQTVPLTGQCTVTSDTTAECAGLSNGTAYTVSVQATNEAGDSFFSHPSDSVTPFTVPEAPTSVEVVPVDSAVQVTWTAPNWNGGSPVTGYTATVSPSDGTCVSTGATSATCSGLGNGTPYTVSVVATNAAGDSVASDASVAVTPRTVPGSPTDVVAVPGDRTALLSWTPPADSGGAQIESYSASSTPAGGLCEVTGATALCSGLANGTAYQFTVVATNVAGPSVASLPSAAVVPRTTPDTPTGVVVTPRDSAIDVTWAGSAFNGGADIASYTATARPGGASCGWTAGPLACTINDLPNGTAYTVTVTASNAAGDSVASAESAVVTPRTIPSPPTSVVASAGSRTATITWAAPSDSGGAEVTGYLVTARPGGRSCAWSAGPLRCSVNELANGTTYAFTAVAINIAGNSEPSEASAEVTPVSVPGSATDVVATAGDASVVLGWSTPSDDGGSPLTGYRVTSSVDEGTCAVADLTATCTGLTNGTPRTFTVVAENAVGPSAVGATSGAVTPRTVPGAPTAVLGTPGNAAVALAWAAPATTGGADITGYEVTTTPAGGPCSPTGVTGATCVGLVNGTSYSFTVKALNAAGTGVASDPSAPVTPRKVPAAPTGVTALPDNSAAALSWTAPVDTGGSPISGYSVVTTPAGGACLIVGTTANCTALKNGTAYTFAVKAANEAGASLPSLSSAAVTPRTVPDAPTKVAGAPGASSATVTWSAPANTGGSPITAYTVTASPAAGPCTVNALTATCAKLANGLPYTFTVKATNVAGDSLPSASSAAVTPRTIPGPVMAFVGALKEGGVSLTWQQPATSGGAPVLDYKLESRTSADSPWSSQTVEATSVTLSANPGDTVMARVSARNAAGLGPASELASPVVLPVPKVDPPIVIEAQQIVGGQVGEAVITITAKALKPSSSIDAWAFSTQVKLFDDQTDASGSYTTQVKVPTGLEAGDHTLLVRGTDGQGKRVEARIGFKISDDGTVIALVKPNISIQPDENALNAFHALDNPVTLAATAVAAMSLVSVGAAGAGAGAAAAASVRTDLKFRFVEHDEEEEERAWGDRTGFWKIPGTGWFESAILALTIWIGPRSPLVAKLLIDSAPVRAMVGVWSLALPLIALAVGVHSAVEVYSELVPPSAVALTLIMVIGVFDPLAGVLGVGAFCAVALTSGVAHDATHVRFTMGLLLLGAGPGVIAAYIRPYRRALPTGHHDWWERFVDVVMVPIIAGWATTKMVGALSSMAELDLPINEYRYQIGFAVGVAMLLRVVLDHQAVRWYPQRLVAFAPKPRQPGMPQKVGAVVVKGIIFVFVSIAFIGNVWQLWAGLSLLLIPYVLALWTAHLPNSPLLYQVVPHGVPKLLTELTLGSLLVLALHQVMEPGPAFARWAFVLVSIPAFFINTLSLFGRHPADGAPRWYAHRDRTVFYRCVSVVVFCILMYLMFLKK